jgi:hypothetical protein
MNFTSEEFSMSLNNLYESLLDCNVEKFKKNTDLILKYFNGNLGSQCQTDISIFFQTLIEKIGVDILFRYTRTYTEEQPILYFIEKGMDIHTKVKDSFGNYVSLLQLSSAYSNFLLCRNLIERGACINNTVQYETDALYHACLESENTDIIDLLLKNGANPNKAYVENQEYTILHILVMKISRETNFFDGGLISVMISSLLKYGANPYLKDCSGQTSMDVCNPLNRESYKKIISNAEEIRNFYDIRKN